MSGEVVSIVTWSGRPHSLMVGAGLRAASGARAAPTDEEEDKGQDGEVGDESGEVVEDCVEVGAGVGGGGLGGGGGGGVEVGAWEERGWEERRWDG